MISREWCAKRNEGKCGPVAGADRAQIGTARVRRRHERGQEVDCSSRFFGPWFMRCVLALPLLAVLACSSATGVRVPNLPPAQNIAEFEAHLEQLRVALKIPAFSAAIYNGNRFGLLDSVVAHAAKKNFANRLAERILVPLGFLRTAPNPLSQVDFAVMGFDRTQFVSRMAKPYALSGSAIVPSAYPNYFGTAAGLVSPVLDVGK